MVQRESKPEHPRHLRLIGTGAAKGGTYHRVTVLGEGIIDGDLTCRVLRVLGDVEVRGDAEFTRARVIGNWDISGNLEGEHIAMTGQLTVRGRCAAERIRVRGWLSVGGLLNADRTVIRLYGPSRVGEIGGGHIAVRRRRWGGASRTGALLKVDVIEGDDIDLESTIARVVRGNRVRIRSGCTVGLVEYRDAFRQDSSATVREQRRL